jgi:hypothetical protein
MREFLLATLFLLMRFLAWILVLAGAALAVSAVLITANGSENSWLAFAAGWVMTAIGVVGLASKGRPRDRVDSRRG